MMAEAILWKNNLSDVLESAKNEGKLVLVDFFSPT